MTTLLVHPNSEMQKRIREELKENVDTRESDLQIIKEWLRQEPHLPNTWDENRILTFLRGCKFSLEKTKRKLDMYFTVRTAIPEFFANRNIKNPELQEIIKYVNIPPLPGLTPEGRRVVLMRGLDKTITHPAVEDALKIILMIGDVRLAAEKVGVAGDVYILDASCATPAHFAKFTPSHVKKFLVCVEQAYPVKLKEVHVINISPLIDTILAFVKPFLKEKIRNRIHIHSNLESLYKFVPKEILPSEYGGGAGPIQPMHDQWMKILEDHQPWFDEQENIKSDESKRPGKPANFDDLFGLDGSFRQLKID